MILGMGTFSRTDGTSEMLADAMLAYDPSSVAAWFMPDPIAPVPMSDYFM